jgi:ABC-type transporter Mla subunit MlaD
VPLDVTTTAAAPNAENQCPILNLHLGEINLNLLGLHVDTSEICLDVTATDDQGVLGGLLCGLSGGLGLGGILDQLDDVLGAVDTFLGQLEDILNAALDEALTVTDVLGSPLDAGGVVTQQADELCDVLNLSLGPVDLDIPLLGVGVHLDNCEDGPVTVDITADPSGGLLGQILCGIAGGVDTGNLDLDGLIARVDQLIDQLGELSDRLEQLAQTPVNANSLTKQVEKLADRATDTGDLDKLISRVDKAIARADRILPRLL